SPLRRPVLPSWRPPRGRWRGSWRPQGRRPRRPRAGRPNCRRVGTAERRSCRRSCRKAGKRLKLLCRSASGWSKSSAQAKREQQQQCPRRRRHARPPRPRRWCRTFWKATSGTFSRERRRPRPTTLETKKGDFFKTACIYIMITYYLYRLHSMTCIMY
ncbi:unnamed protein product, partial [Heterosigma akashiwo]